MPMAYKWACACERRAEASPVPELLYTCGMQGTHPHLCVNEHHLSHKGNLTHGTQSLSNRGRAPGTMRSEAR